MLQHASTYFNIAIAGLQVVDGGSTEIKNKNRHRLSAILMFMSVYVAGSCSTTSTDATQGFDVDEARTWHLAMLGPWIR